MLPSKGHARLLANLGGVEAIVDLDAVGGVDDGGALVYFAWVVLSLS